MAILINLQGSIHTSRLLSSPQIPTAILSARATPPHSVVVPLFLLYMWTQASNRLLIVAWPAINSIPLTTPQGSDYPPSVWQGWLGLPFPPPFLVIYSRLFRSFLRVLVCTEFCKWLFRCVKTPLLSEWPVNIVIRFYLHSSKPQSLRLHWAWGGGVAPDT